MIHIVFNEKNIEVLQQAMLLDETLQADVHCIKDDFSIGTVIDIYDTYGYQQRKAWKHSLYENTPLATANPLHEDKETMLHITKLLDKKEEEQLWIWMAQNQRDVCGYYWLMSQLKGYQGRIQVLYLNNLPFINEKGNIFYPTQLHQIQPKEFLKAKKLTRPITISEFEIDPDEWKKICNENAMIRILEGGKKIVSKNDNYFDSDILSGMSADTAKLGKLINTVTTKLNLKISEECIIWRVKELAKTEALQFKGDWQKGWKEIEILVQKPSITVE